MTTRSMAVRLFFTCWIVYTLHFATNIVREIYPALALGDHLSFRLDEYAGLHPDLFETEGHGWHINANVGVSMVAAVPYAMAKPVIDTIVARVRDQRAARGLDEPPPYKSPWPMAREFYAEAWRRGYDIKFGLAALVMQAFCMAPSSAIGVVAMFLLLQFLLDSDRTALWMALLYAFGTPVFFRTGYLNHNLMLGHIGFLGLLALWNPWERPWRPAKRYAAAGLAGGFCLLFDYGGVVLLGGLGLYALALGRREPAGAVRSCLWFCLGAVPPILLLWFYQWQSFGHPFYPPQHWMATVRWIGEGYQGFGPPSPELLWANLFDYRYGLFTSAPVLLLGLAAPFVLRGNRRLRRRELVALLGLFALAWLFYSGVSYSRLQFNTGVRYMTAIVPLLFVPAAMVFIRLPRWAAYPFAVLAVTMSWCLAMHRDVERGFGVLDPILHVFLGGFRLPALTALSRMPGLLPEQTAGGVSPLPLFALTAAILYGVWTIRLERGE